MSHTLTISDVAAALNICTRSLYYRIEKRGLYSAVKIGRRLRFSPEVFNSPLALAG